MIEAIFILVAINLVLTTALCVREYEKQRNSSKSVEEFSKVMREVEAPPFQEPDWLTKIKAALERKVNNETPDEESEVVPGHLIEESLAGDELRETSEERELVAEEKANRKFQQERGL